MSPPPDATPVGGTNASRGSPPDEPAVTETALLRSGLDYRADSLRPRVQGGAAVLTETRAQGPALSADGVV